MVITGIVEQGKHLGRRLGFPTANILPNEPLPVLPANGVYAAAFWVEGDALAQPCMLNQGVHPTVPDGKPTIEAHLLDFHGDLYGQQARVEYLRFIRPERRFESLEALTAQLARDREAVAAWLDAARRGDGADPESMRAGEIAWHP